MYLVPRTGIKPALPCHNHILSLARLRIPPSGQFTPECSAQVILTTLFQLSVCYNSINRATQNNTKDYKSVPQGHKKTPISIRFRSFYIQGLSASFHSADFPEWRPYSKLFNEPLRVSLPFLLFVCSREQAPVAALKQKSLSLS